MELLRIVTLVYVGVLVAALAASLIAIFIWLRKIARVLGEAREALTRVETGTRPLTDLIGPLEESAVGLADTVADADASLARADEHLAALAGRLGVPTSTDKP